MEASGLGSMSANYADDGSELRIYWGVLIQQN